MTTLFAAISLKSPSGPAWEFLVLFVVVIVGPPLLEKARLPGIVGLLIGGYAIGPHGLNVIGAGDTTVPQLGQIGLLYLMFVAGVELDLALLRVHRSAVITFALITFACPMALGLIIGFSLSWTAPAAILLGSLFASHTLLLYPNVRRARLTTHPAVATAVGATVITDTLSLVVLAAVSGSQRAGGSTLSIALQVLLGLVGVVLFSLVALPRVARLAFRALGTDRVVRYLLAIAAFLGAATVAEVLGIEGIVGAFFAGLGLNRLVPNEGPLMDRIDFFGAAVFVPIFLVSVGMLLDPSVMIQGETLKLAGLFVLAAIGGKTIAATIAHFTLGYSRPDATLMLGLTLPQAAATLAATVVGFNIGLFGQHVVNAILVLILVSIIAGTLIVERAKTRVEVPQRQGGRLGMRILIALEDPSQSSLAFALGARVARPDTGVVRGFLRSSPGEARERESGLAELRTAGYRVGLDTDPALLVHGSLAEGVINLVAGYQPSLVLIGQRHAAQAPALGSAGEAVAATTATPVAILIGDATRIESVMLIETASATAASDSGAGLIAAQLAERIGGRNLTRGEEGELRARTLPAGRVCIASVSSYELLAASDPPPGAAFVFVLEPPGGGELAVGAGAELRLAEG